MKRAYKFRAYPTRPQERRALRLLTDHCDLYNAALMERREAWRARHISIKYGTQSAQLKDIRCADPNGQGRHSFTAQQQTLRRVNTVFGTFFDRVRAAEITGHNKKIGYPRFKPGSGNYKRIRRELAREWRKIRNRRRDFHHKTVQALIKSCDVIALEDLNVAGMSRRPAAKPDLDKPATFLPNRARAKAGLNTSILDAG